MKQYNIEYFEYIYEIPLVKIWLHLIVFVLEEEK